MQRFRFAIDVVNECVSSPTSLPWVALVRCSSLEFVGL